MKIKMLFRCGKMIKALELVLLFYTGGPWDDKAKALWLSITGNEEATTKSMCDYIRKVLK